jgi:hypothetical protein
VVPSVDLCQSTEVELAPAKVSDDVRVAPTVCVPAGAAGLRTIGAGGT